jgi:hypothetical protein
LLAIRPVATYSPMRTETLAKTNAKISARTHNICLFKKKKKYFVWFSFHTILFFTPFLTHARLSRVGEEEEKRKNRSRCFSNAATKN